MLAECSVWLGRRRGWSRPRLARPLSVTAGLRQVSAILEGRRGANGLADEDLLEESGVDAHAAVFYISDYQHALEVSLVSQSSRRCLLILDEQITNSFFRIDHYALQVLNY